VALNVQNEVTLNFFCRRAFVFTADGNDLAELLVRNGLARIYGTGTPLPDGRDSRTYLATLRGLEQQAKSAGVGGWRY
jgi:endonuclease YncB( thermonuclease family)